MHRFVHLRDNKVEQNEFIYSYWDNGAKYQVTDEDIRVNVKISIVSLGLEKHGIMSNRVLSYSLRSRGAMEIKFSGADNHDTKNMGRWSSDTFLIYVHDQLA